MQGVPGRPEPPAEERQRAYGLVIAAVAGCADGLVIAAVRALLRGGREAERAGSGMSFAAQRGNTQAS
jgi:hypothetical protein